MVVFSTFVQTLWPSFSMLHTVHTRSELIRTKSLVLWIHFNICIFRFACRIDKNNDFICTREFLELTHLSRSWRLELHESAILFQIEIFFFPPKLDLNWIQNLDRINLLTGFHIMVVFRSPG